MRLKKETIEAVKEGEVIIFPTDTVYGLICDATSEIAVKRLFQIKKRPRAKPIPVFVKDIKMAKKLTLISKSQEIFLKKVWPGRITVVLKAKKKLPKGTLSKGNKIGLRIPNYKLLNNLLARTGFPLSATSANITGKPPSVKIKEVMKQFEKRKFQPDFFIDAGNLKPSKPSTVVDLTEKEIKVLRAGAVSRKELIKIFQ
jgi:L-threonylcarbamoyladenylate synthase